MNRPPVNALHLDLAAELTEVAQTVAADDTLRVVVLRSASSEYFMAGADLAMIDQGWTSIGDIALAVQGAVDQWEAVPQPTIAAIDGVAAGAGCELALGCDVRILSQRATIGLPEVRVGLVPAGGGTQRLVRLIGLGPAMDLLLTGDLIDSGRAQELGLATRLADNGELEKVVEKYVDHLQQLPPHGLRAVKECARQALPTNLEGGLAVERRQIERLGLTHDGPEGVRAFLEKRDPHFKGH